MEKKKIPELRFPEFHEEWEEKRLGKVANIERGRFSPRPRNNPIYYNGHIPFVQTSDVVNSKGYIKAHTQTLNEKGLSVSKLFKKGDILITIAANIGYAGILQYDMACPDSLIGIKCNSKTYNLFLCLLLNLEQKKMDYLAVAAAQKNINLGFLKPYKLLFPSLPEQQKTADFLSKVDEKIEKIEIKKEFWELYKKGMMQKIFSQKIRFKDDNGVDYPEWEEKKFSDIFNFHSTNSYSRALMDTQIGSIHNIHYGDIHKKYSSSCDTEKYKIPYVKKDVDISKIKNDSYCVEGDLIIADASEDYDDIGKAIELLNIKNKKIVAGLHTFLVRDKDNLTAKGYRGYILLNPNAKKELKKIATGISVLSLSKSNLSKFILNLPSLSEQKKIASFLSAIDSKIKVIDKELQGLKEFKKGLLQKMFV